MSLHIGSHMRVERVTAYKLNQSDIRTSQTHWDFTAVIPQRPTNRALKSDFNYICWGETINSIEASKLCYNLCLHIDPAWLLISSFADCMQEQNLPLQHHQGYNWQQSCESEIISQLVRWVWK